MNVVSQKIIKHNLDAMLSYEFFLKKFEVDFLLTELLRSFDFSKGSFFTILPSEANLDRIHEFHEGGVLKQNPIIKTVNGSRYQLVNSMKSELAPFLSEMVHLNSKESWVFIEADGGFSEEPQEFYKDYGVAAKNNNNDSEIYFILNQTSANLNNLEKCVHICGWPIWFFWDCLQVLI